MKPSLKILAATILCLAALSCKDSHDGPTIAIYQNIVTFTGNVSNTVVFEYQEMDDSPIVRLTVPGQISTDNVPAGSRLLLTYSLPDDVAYGEDCSNITLRGLQTIYGGTVTTLPHSSASQYNQPINLITIFRTGHYINFTTMMPALDGREYTLAAAEESIATGNVEMYLTTSTQSTASSYNTRQVGSIDISPVWDLSDVKSITIHVNNTQNPNSTEFTFTK